MITIPVSKKCTFAVLSGLCLLVGYSFCPSHPERHHAQPGPQSHSSDQVRFMRIDQRELSALKYGEDPEASLNPASEPEPATNTTLNLAKIRVEALIARGHYKEAISVIKRAYQDCDIDKEMVLDLGKAYDATGNYFQAIEVLQPLRSDYISTYSPLEAGISSPLSVFHNGGREQPDSYDWQVRKILEHAVLGIYGLGDAKPLQAANPLYKNNEQYKMLTACLAVGRMCHAGYDSHQSVSAIAYRLATENAGGLPPSVVNSMIVTGSVNRRWNKLATLTLNARSEEETDWYLDCLQNETARLPANDVRVAATAHLVALRGAAPEQRTLLLQSVLKSCLLHYGSETLEAANCTYDLAMSFYMDRRFEEADRMFRQALTEFVREKAVFEAGDTHYNLALVRYGMHDTVGAKKEFAAASDCFRRTNDRRDAEAADANRALLCVEYATAPADEQFLVNRFALSKPRDIKTLDDMYKPNDAIASAQLGLYYFKRGDIANAEDPLKKAASIYFPVSAGPELPALMGSTSGLLPDSLTDKQVLKRLFSKYLRIQDNVASRYSLWAESPFGNYDRHQFSEGRDVSTLETVAYRGVVRTIYEQILRKEGKLAELAQFQKRCSKLWRVSDHLAWFWDHNLNKVSKSDAYPNTIARHIYESWYCPAHSETEQAIYRFKIDKDGNIERVTAVQPGSNKEFNQSILEIAQLTFALPKPPIGWTGCDLEIKFNGQSNEALDYGRTEARFVPESEGTVRKYY